MGFGEDPGGSIATSSGNRTSLSSVLGSGDSSFVLDNAWPLWIPGLAALAIGALTFHRYLRLGDAHIPLWWLFLGLGAIFVTGGLVASIWGVSPAMTASSGGRPSTGPPRRPRPPVEPTPRTRATWSESEPAPDLGRPTPIIARRAHTSLPNPNGPIRASERPTAVSPTLTARPASQPASQPPSISRIPTSAPRPLSPTAASPVLQAAVSVTPIAMATPARVPVAPEAPSPAGPLCVRCGTSIVRGRSWWRCVRCERPYCETCWEGELAAKGRVVCPICEGARSSAFA